MPKVAKNIKGQVAHGNGQISGEEMVNVTSTRLLLAMERVLYGGCTQDDGELMDALLEGRVNVQGRVAIPCSDGFILGSPTNA